MIAFCFIFTEYSNRNFHQKAASIKKYNPIRICNIKEELGYCNKEKVIIDHGK